MVIAFSFQKMQEIPSSPADSNDLSYLPQPSYISPLSLGNTESVASLLWIDALIQYGGSLFANQQYLWLSRIADLVTILDPHLETVYNFVGTVGSLNTADSTDLKILKRGIEAFPDHWRIALFYSMRAIDFDSNFTEAANTMRRFANDSTVPDYIRRVHRTYESRIDPYGAGLLLLLEDYMNPQYASFRKGIENQIRTRTNPKAITRIDSQIDLLLSQLREGVIEPLSIFKALMDLHASARNP
jgi:hypothetical protein